jgi:hypothetical protein
MLNLWSVPIWVLLVCGAITTVPTFWKVRRGNIRGPVAISMSGLASVLEAAAFISLVIVHPFALHLQLTALFTLLSWLLETWTKRIKSSSKRDPVLDKGSTNSVLEVEGKPWYS